MGVAMNKQEFYISELEELGRERLKNMSLGYCCNSSQVETSAAFRFKDFDMQFASLDELKSTLGRQWRCRLRQLAGLVGWLDSWVPKTQKSKKMLVAVDLDPESQVVESPLFSTHAAHACSCAASKVDYEALPPLLLLSHTSKTLASIYRTPNIIKNVIRYARGCGLAQCVDNSYKTYSSLRRRSFSKKYAINTVVLVQLKELMREAGIAVPKKLNADAKPISREALASMRHTKEELYYKVRLGKCMKTPGLKEEDVARMLSYKYQDVLYPMLSRIELYNKGRPDEQKMSFNFNIRFDKNGYNIKNGCRAWSYAAMKPTEAKAKHKGEETFESWFKQEFGTKPWEYDVHSSVFKINRGFNTGTWEDSNEDSYAVMFPNVDRKVAKSIAMLYMFEHSGKKIVSSLSRACPGYAKKHGIGDISQVMSYWYGFVHSYMGESLGNLVFLLEDSFYSTVDVALMRRGYKFVRKFDCWCFAEGNHPSARDMDHILARCFKTWYAQEAAPLKARLSKLESAGVKELKKMFEDEEEYK